MLNLGISRWDPSTPRHKLPALHSPSKKYATAGDVQRHKKNRPFFKKLGGLSKSTLWHALAETDNSPEPFMNPATSYDRHGRSSWPRSVTAVSKLGSQSSWCYNSKTRSFFSDTNNIQIVVVRWSSGSDQVLQAEGRRFDSYSDTF